MDRCEPCWQVETYQLEWFNEANFVASVINNEDNRPAAILNIDFRDHSVNYGLDFVADGVVCDNCLFDIDKSVVYGLNEGGQWMLVTENVSDFWSHDTRYHKIITHLIASTV